MQRLAQHSDGPIRSFFLAHGYGAAYSTPRLEKSSKAARIAAAVEAADRDGRRDEILEAVVQQFGFDVLQEGKPSNQNRGGVIPLRPPGDQARQVRAWFNLFDSVPTVLVVNNSDAPIRDVVPAVWVESSSPGALIGGTPLWNAALAELPPFRAFAWPMSHLSGVVGDGSSRSHLLVDFTDAAGQRWQLGHDQLVEVGSVSPNLLRYVEFADTSLAVDSLELPVDVVAEASATSEKVAFLSYVHEDAIEVDRLQQFLESNGVTVWRDRNELSPGDNWRDVIQECITQNSFAFLACFSAASVTKEKTHMNEELGLAIEELRSRNTTHWFLPVLLTPCEPPNYPIGVHGYLRNIQQARLYENWSEVSQRLLASIRRLA
jgi:hypothetical protein